MPDITQYKEKEIQKDTHCSKTYNTRKFKILFYVYFANDKLSTKHTLSSFTYILTHSSFYRQILFHQQKKPL
jgi:hypothetical protein